MHGEYLNRALMRRHRALITGVAASTIIAFGLPEKTVAGPLQVSIMEGASPCVALTFDDGPDVDLTPKLLTILEERGVNATFFVVGSRAATWPDPVDRANRDGDEIGNHSWDHPVLPSLASDVAMRELTRTDDIIQKIIGHAPAYTRAPYGSLSFRIAGLTPRTFVGWNVDTLDWRYPNVDRITKVAVSTAVNGSIILVHDIHPKTIAAVPGIIDGLRQRGFGFVTVSQLLGGSCGGHPVGFDFAGEETKGSHPAIPPLTTSKATPKATGQALPQQLVATPRVVVAGPMQYSVFDGN